MPIVNTYQQTFTTTQDSTYEWFFKLNTMPKQKPDNKFVVKIAMVSALAGSPSPTITSGIGLFMTHPDLTACSSSYQLIIAAPANPTGTVLGNKLILMNYVSVAAGNQTQRNNTTVLARNINASVPIRLNMEYLATQVAPTSGSMYFNLTLMFYEIEGDVIFTID